MKTESIRVSAVIPASPHEVYAAWMSSKGHAAMTGSSAKIVNRVGGRFSAWEDYISGTTVALEPDTLIRQAWRTTDFPAGAPDSTIEIRLAKTGRGTRVTIAHEGIPAGQSADYRKGWKDFYFVPMKGYFSSRT
ncbi:MAG TPA: SRPBCC domain-containing protein [Spirochaetia bacterium]